MNGQDHSTHNGGGENLEQLGCASSSVGIGKGERHEQIGYVMGQGRGGQRDGEDVRAEIALRNDLEPAPKFSIMDKGRTTGDIRSIERLRQE